MSKSSSLPAVVLLTGPTASGKSGLAVRIAEELDGIVINADSMQVYSDLDVLTARPPRADLDRVEHRLYGVLDGAECCSAGRWRGMALAEIDRGLSQGKLPVIVGGTGLYIKALEEGIAEIPAVPEEVRAEGMALCRSEGGEAFRARLMELDPQAASRLTAGDTQRLVRAWEVWRHTGVTLSDWHQKGREQVLEPAFNFVRMALMPDRERLYDNCNRRFDLMLEQGALEEVRKLLERQLPGDLPVMKSLGVPELAEYLRGNLSLEEARPLAQQNTRRYAKRQMTWIRNQFSSSKWISEQLSESFLPEIFNFIRQSA
ncbi:tRNA (adenosine(37)-N6)-dimethylallyltransferase MiaA [Kiloniella sp. b19]|uniref:tRNA (adenosine(37)-N6)-dimethylallyltransferase MiaA n=1 Tax=Kiloniella sp. GXU_MW_B19 TaxID=3141326 RepID=UPI0031D61AF4